MLGLVSTLCGSDDGTVIGDRWTASVKSLGATAIKVPLVTSRVGSLPTQLYQRGLDAAERAGLDVLGVFTRGLLPVAGESSDCYSNMPLYVGPFKNPLLSRYIDQVTLRAEGMARSLVHHGMTRYVAGNEPNEHALIEAGVPVDAASDKAGAMAPSVFSAYCWQMASRLKSVGATKVYCGALSLLPGTGLDDSNGYFAAYLDLFYGFLAHHGQHAPYPFDGWLVNSEGIWKTGEFTRAVTRLRTIMASHGDTGEVIVGEAGITNAALPANADLFRQTYAEMAETVPEVYIFQHHGSQPFLDAPAIYRSWGCVQWRVLGSELVPGADYLFAPVVRTLAP